MNKNSHVFKITPNGNPWKATKKIVKEDSRKFWELCLFRQKKLTDKEIFIEPTQITSMKFEFSNETDAKSAVTKLKNILQMIRSEADSSAFFSNLLDKKIICLQVNEFFVGKENIIAKKIGKLLNSINFSGSSRYNNSKYPGIFPSDKPFVTVGYIQNQSGVRIEEPTLSSF